MIYPYTLTRVAKIKRKKPDTLNSDRDVEQQELWFIAGGNEKWHSHSGRHFGSSLQI